MCFTKLDSTRCLNIHPFIALNSIVGSITFLRKFQLLELIVLDINCLIKVCITAESKLMIGTVLSTINSRPEKVTESSVWNIGRVRDSFEAHLFQVIGYWEEIMDWCIFLIQIPSIRVEELWPLVTKFPFELSFQSLHKLLFVD